VDSTTGVRQGPCEGPVLFLFTKHHTGGNGDATVAGGMAIPDFMTRESGVAMGESSNRKRDATSFELWTSLFAEPLRALLQNA
jgi:hypothetical protein